MKTASLATLLAIGISAGPAAMAQDVQGFGSGKAATPEQRTNTSQDSMKGEVIAVDEANGKISIRLSGTVGSSDSARPTVFKVQDGLLFNAVKPGDKVAFTTERVGDDMTIKALTKE